MTPEQIVETFGVAEALKVPFPENNIHWRIGATNKKTEARRTNNNNAKATKGVPLAYIDARDVMRRLDEVVGIGNWRDEYAMIGSRLFCKLSLKVDGDWITKMDCGSESETEAEKGQVSDAFKRAAVKWGVGRYLYYMPAEWVDLDQYGKFKPPAIPSNLTRQRYLDELEMKQELPKQEKQT